MSMNTTMNANASTATENHDKDSRKSVCLRCGRPGHPAALCKKGIFRQLKNGLTFLEPRRESEFEKYIDFIKQSRILELNIISLLPMDAYVLRTLLKINNNKHFRHSKKVETYLHERLSQMALKLIEGVRSGKKEKQKEEKASTVVKGNKVPVEKVKEKEKKEKEEKKKQKEKKVEKAQALRLEREAKLLETAKNREEREQKRENREKERLNMEKKRMAVFELNTANMIAEQANKLASEYEKVKKVKVWDYDEQRYVPVYKRDETTKETADREKAIEDNDKKRVKNYSDKQDAFDNFSRKWVALNQNRPDILEIKRKVKKGANGKEDKGNTPKKHTPSVNTLFRESKVPEWYKTKEERSLEKAKEKYDQKLKHKKSNDKKQKQQTRKDLESLGLAFA